jgi:hypothetical protein
VELPDFSLQLGIAALKLVVLVDFQPNSLHHEAMNLFVVFLLELLTQARHSCVIANRQTGQKTAVASIKQNIIISGPHLGRGFDSLSFLHRLGAQIQKEA